jgi:hypothetical protein
LTGLQVIDTSHSREDQATQYSTTGYAVGVTLSGSHAYLADRDAGLQILDISNPAGPQQVGVYQTLGEAEAIAVSGNRAYLAERRSGVCRSQGKLTVLDVASPANPRFMGAYELSGLPNSVNASGNHVYVTEGSFEGPHRVEIIDSRDSANLQLVSTWETAGRCWSIALTGTHAYLAIGHHWEAEKEFYGWGRFGGARYFKSGEAQTDCVPGERRFGGGRGRGR